MLLKRRAELTGEAAVSISAVGAAGPATRPAHSFFQFRAHALNVRPAGFRVGGKIFATLSLEREGYGVLLLDPEQQAGMVADAPEIFSPVPGGWGRKGSTRVRLTNVPKDVLESALRTAWRRRAPKKILRERTI